MEALLREVVGTMILIILGAGVCGGVILKRTKNNSSDWIVIAMGWGLAVAMSGYITGAGTNPAFLLANAVAGDFPWADVPAYIVAQFVGAILGSTIVWLHYYPHWKETEDKAAKLAVFCTAPAIRSTIPNLMSEIIGTFVLVNGVLGISRSQNEVAKGLAPFLVGFLIVAIGLSLGGTTGYAINPARDLGPRIAHFILPIAGKGDSDWKYSWIPVVGPIIGAVTGVQFFKAYTSSNAASAVGVLIVALIIAILIGYSSKRNEEVSNKANF